VKSHGDSSRKSGVGNDSHVLCVKHKHAVSSYLVIICGHHDQTKVFLLTIRIVNKERLAEVDTLFWPTSDGVAVAVINLNESLAIFAHKHFGDPGIARLFSSYLWVLNWESISIFFSSQNVSISDLFSFQIYLVPSVYWAHGDCLTATIHQPWHVE